MATNDIRAAVLGAITKVKQGARVELGDDDSFGLLGLDSLDRMSILLEVESALGITLEDVEPKRIDCINDYVAAIRRQVSARAA